MSAARATIPARRPLRVVGDVHGDARAFAYAVATDRFVVQLGDLVDGGPDSAGALRLAFRLLDEGRGLFVLGNHDRKLGRLLAGDRVRPGAELTVTLAALDAPLRARTLHEFRHAPLWLRSGSAVFVHGGFHPAMLHEPSPPGLGHVTPAASRALFGQTTGRMQADGYPERVIDWVERIPPGIALYCGHDRRSTDGRPLMLRNRGGGSATFLDTGAGKGGHLSWLDVDPPA